MDIIKHVFLTVKSEDKLAIIIARLKNNKQHGKTFYLVKYDGKQYCGLIYMSEGAVCSYSNSYNMAAGGFYDVPIEGHVYTILPCNQYTSWVENQASELEKRDIDDYVDSDVELATETVEAYAKLHESKLGRPPTAAEFEAFMNDHGIKTGPVPAE